MSDHYSVANSKEFWMETPAAVFPLIEVRAVGGKIFVTLLQGFGESIYYDALIEELKESGIDFTECGNEPITVADILIKA